MIPSPYSFDSVDLDHPQVYVVIVTIQDLNNVTKDFINVVNNQSWMMELDPGSKRAYAKSVEETTKILVEVITNGIEEDDSVSSEFGEILVSISAGEALKSLLSHIALPLSELWKPQKRQNEGFDFHTICPNSFINYGEAKYLKSSSPHKQALLQIEGFLEAEKHFKDRVYLRDIVPAAAIENLDNEEYGAIAAFSVNAKNPEKTIQNAFDNISKEIFDLVKKIYLVGVICNP